VASFVRFDYVAPLIIGLIFGGTIEWPIIRCIFLFLYAIFFPGIFSHFFLTTAWQALSFGQDFCGVVVKGEQWKIRVEFIFACFLLIALLAFDSRDTCNIMQKINENFKRFEGAWETDERNASELHLLHLAFWIQSWVICALYQKTWATNISLNTNISSI